MSKLAGWTPKAEVLQLETATTQLDQGSIPLSPHKSRVTLKVGDKPVTFLFSYQADFCQFLKSDRPIKKS